MNKGRAVIPKNKHDYAIKMNIFYLLQDRPHHACYDELVR